MVRKRGRLIYAVDKGSAEAYRNRIVDAGKVKK
jgi:hypothetical protein